MTEKKEISFVEYEYKEITVPGKQASMQIDCYECFGWMEEGTEEATGKPDSIVMKFKRDRKIRNKAELTRLQRQFEACVKEIISMEKSKKTKAAAIAYVVGVVGTAFMAGSVFAVNAGNIPLCVVLAIPAFIGWILPYLFFRSVSGKKTEAINPLIELKYDELYDVCKKANALLD